MDATQFSSASTSGAPSYASADGDDNNAGGVKVWVLVLLFALLLLPLLPSAVRRGGTPWGGAAGGGGGYRRGWISFKSGWDVVNLCLVLFAILCGLLGRSGDGDASPSARRQQAAGKKLLERQMATEAPGMDAVWESYGSAYPGGVQQQQHAGGSGIRRMKSTSSYPELRLGSDGVWALASPDAAWRFRDDADLYRARRPERPWDVHPQRTVKTIPVDTFVERRQGSPPRERRRSVERMAEVEDERTRQKTVGPATSGRRWTVDAVPEQQQAAPPSPPPPPAPAPVPPRRRRGSLENFPRPEELEEVRNPSQAPWRRRRSRSVENLPRPEEVLVEEVIIQGIRNPPPAAMVPPVTPPSTASRSTKKRSGSVGGAKELASAIALFYQKKRKSITMKAKRRPHHHHHSDDHCSPPSSDTSASPEATANSTAPPPPPPPPPASIFSNLFKKGSKSRRIHSVAPPSPPTTRRSRKPPTPPARPAPPAPPPPPVRPRAHAHPQQPPMYPRRVYYTYYPLPPPSPPLPPAPLVSEGEEDAPSVTASPAPAYCASPDVNAKADRFIESFREGLKLEKLNSYREKWQRQIHEEAVVEDEDGEFMVIGSLFGDDDELPETPAVAVGFKRH
jgi:hypothetical protein